MRQRSHKHKGQRWRVRGVSPGQQGGWCGGSGTSKWERSSGRQREGAQGYGEDCAESCAKVTTVALPLGYTGLRATFVEHPSDCEREKTGAGKGGVSEIPKKAVEVPQGQMMGGWMGPRQWRVDGKR